MHTFPRTKYELSEKYQEIKKVIGPSRHEAGVYRSLQLPEEFILVYCDSYKRIKTVVKGDYLHINDYFDFYCQVISSFDEK